MKKKETNSLQIGSLKLNTLVTRPGRKPEVNVVAFEGSGCLGTRQK